MASKITVSEALGLSSCLVSETPALDAQVLLKFVLQVDDAYLRTWPDSELSDAQEREFRAALAKRKEGMPVAYITRSRGFWSLDLEVSEHTLIPRPDTECLVEAILERFDHSPLGLLDLGTGTGAIALALASERPSWNVLATDFEPAAIELAKRNARCNGVATVDFGVGSWFEAVPNNQLFDVIVSSPPYIDSGDIHLTQGDVRYEPRSALVAQERGFADIRQIADQARHYFNKVGALFFEHGYDQGEKVRQLMQACGYEHVETCRDFGGNERFTYGYYDSDSKEVSN